MPTITRMKRKTNYKKNLSTKSSDITKIYNSQNWKKLRNAYLMEHPLCEKCLEDGIIKPTKEIHHIQPISSGENELRMKELALDPTNLMALCEECHHEIHNKNRKKK